MNIYNLEGLPTRVLMKYRDKCYAVGQCGYDPTNNKNECIPLSSILLELMTREHIPNKKEAKVLRQQRAKNPRG